MSSLVRAAIADLDADRSPPLKKFAIFITVMVVIATCLRFWSRSLGMPPRYQPRFMWDDWTALASACVILGQFGVSFGLLHLGFGHHIWMLPSENLEPFLKLLFTTYFFVYTGLTLAKTSALLFFSRIFPRNGSPTWFNVGITFAHVLNVAWLVGMVFGTALNCIPVAKNWDVKGTLPGNCGPNSSIWIASVVPSVFIDLVILVLPLPRIWSIKTSNSRKFGLTVVFVLGYLAVIISVGRMITVLKDIDAINNDFSYEGVADVYWVSTEGPCVLLGVNIPPMLTLGRHIKSKYLSPIANSISRVRSKYRGSHGTCQNKGEEVPAGNPSVYHNACSGQGKLSTTTLHPSTREMEPLQIAPHIAHLGSHSPNTVQMQPQETYAQPYCTHNQYPQVAYPQAYYDQLQYNQPQYFHPQYPQPQYPQPQYPQPQYFQPQYFQTHHADQIRIDDNIVSADLATPKPVSPRQQLLSRSWKLLPR